ncbi:hypothetical protein Dsin_014826 [Dipteronia sinensis]|uniref:Uncharacterized protein n=1 Tax=Dipteronia sinensis TaxID=43782 RepID=A0AAE0AMI3_9ROSI|nr:hypothetical protein Dsin_014826 [Dipteronia sinensis]
MVGSVGTVMLRKGAWTEEEDKLLRKCIEIVGEGKWHQVPLRAGLNRCRKSCRLRWLNYLKPNINRGEFQPDEVDLMVRLHKLLGNRWSLIAGRLPGRTSNDVKNYWNTHKQKKLAISTNEKITEKRKITKTIIIKPRPRTFSKTSPWLKEKLTILEKENNNNNNKNNNDNNNNNNGDTMWWESVLEDNGGSTSSTLVFGVEPFRDLWVDEENIGPAAAMEVGDRWNDISFEEDLWDFFTAI